LKKASDRQKEIKGTLFEEYWEATLKSKKFPPLMLTYYGPHATLVVNDPDILNEVYVSKNKYVDKDVKFWRIFKPLIGDSILFSDSNEKWATKRKHLSVAFYKDKLSEMLTIIIEFTNNQVQKWKAKHVGGPPLDIFEGISNLILEGILLCVFGVDSTALGELKYL
jgi:cytochrome P450